MDLLLWVLLPLIVFLGGLAWLRRARRRGAADISAAVTPEAAAEASARLSAQGHTEVYRSIAQGNFMAAVQAYRSNTRASVKESLIAVQSLEKFPQVYKHPDLD